MLTWQNWNKESDDVVVADSALEAPSPYTHAYYSIDEDSGFRPGRPNQEPGFILTLVQTDGEDEIREIDLGDHHQDLDAAKAAAERYEQTGDVYAGEDGLRLRDFNLNATFLPQEPAGDDGTVARPCIEVGGVQVYAYFDEDTGRLVISAHYDTADPAVLNPAGCVPTVVTIGDTTVFEA